MNRRRFLGFLGLAPVAATLPAIAAISSSDRALAVAELPPCHAPLPDPYNPPRCKVTLAGEGGFSREQVRALIGQLNEAMADGAQCNVSLSPSRCKR